MLLGFLGWQLSKTTSVPVTLVFLLLLFRLEPNLSQLSNNLAALARLSGPVRAVEALLARDDKAPMASGTIAHVGLKRAISFRDVSFRYAKKSHRLCWTA